jgi:hypothetical protein
MNRPVVTTLVVVAVLTTGCTAHKPRPSATSQHLASPPIPTTDVDQATPSSMTGPRYATDTQAPAGGAAGDTAATEPNGAAAARATGQPFHDDDFDLVEPLAWPEPPPADAPPVEIAAWVATVLTNTSADQPFDPAAIAPYLTSELAADYRTNTRRAVAASPEVVTRGVILSTELDATTATSSQTYVDTVIELTTNTTGGFDIQVLRFTLTRRPDQGWIVVGITTASAGSR